MTAAILEGRCIWRIPDMPHRDWDLVGVEDLGEPAHTCEACGKTEIRYVHEIWHAEFRTLLVGCVCCEHLTGDYVNPRRREQELRNEAARRNRRRDTRGAIRARARAAWDGMRWQVSDKGNPWTKVDGLRIVVFPAGEGYRCLVGDVFGVRTYGTALEAKRACLVGFEYVHQKGD
jgi:hypothetical protein